MSGETRTSVGRRVLALCALSAGLSMISAAFGFFYVKIFLNVYKIQEHWFQTAQVLFLIWNAVNDPLFAYLQDTTNWSFTRTRRESVLYAAPLFALSFLVPWFPWGDPDAAAPWVKGLHLITALCFWDTMYTYVGLAYSCLITELSRDNEDRLHATQATQLATLTGPLTIVLLQQASGQLDNFRAFQAMCALVAVVSCLLMRHCGHHAHTERDLARTVEQDQGTTEPKQTLAYLTITKQILFNVDFLSFVIMNFFQEFHRAFLHGFFTIVADQLIVKGAIPDLVRSGFYGAAPVIAKVV